VQSLKQAVEIVFTDEGMQIDRRDEHFEKADSPKIEISTAHSNVKYASRPHSLKSDSEIS
jgi:hypothetical protein